LIGCNRDIRALQIIVTALRSFYIGLLPAVLLLGLTLFMIYIYKTNTDIWGCMWATRFSAHWGGCKIYQWWLTLILLMWRTWWVPNDARRWQMGFNLAFKSYWTV